MELGFFMPPYHPPERSIRDALAWDLQVLRWGDELGFTEVWLGEHFTIGWEPFPSPDLVAAQALLQTKRMKIGIGAFLVPYHHPVELAHRIAFLDHMADGRFMFAISPGSIPTDEAMFATGGRNREMTEEGLEIMLKIWAADGPFRYDGRFWSVDYPAYDPIFAGPHLKPLQRPHPPIALTAVAKGSPSMRLAGARGYIPITLAYEPGPTYDHWRVYSSAALEAGLPKPDRSIWRVVREIFVADSDEEAMHHCLESPSVGRRWSEYASIYSSRMAIKAGLPDPQLTAQKLAKQTWLVGSPETVATKLTQLYEHVGGFGHLTMMANDFIDDAAAYRRSLELLVNEVMPRVSHLTPAAEPALS